MYVNPRSFLVTDPKCSFDSPPSDLVSLSCDMLENVQLVIDWQLVWSNLKKQVEEQKLTNWSWSCDKAGTIRIWPRSWAAAHVVSANTDSFSSLFANKNLWNVWNACDWLRNIFFPKDIRAAFLQPETHVCCISVTFSANLAWTQLLVWSDSLQPTTMCHTCAASRVRILGSFSIWDFFIQVFLPTSHFVDFFMLTLGRGRVFYSFFHWPFFCASFFVSRPRLRLILTSHACFLSDSSLGSCERESGHRLVPVLYVPHKQESPQSSRCDASVPTALPPSWVCAVLWSVDALVLADWTTVSCVFV